MRNRFPLSMLGIEEPLFKGSGGKPSRNQEEDLCSRRDNSIGIEDKGEETGEESFENLEILI